MPPFHGHEVEVAAVHLPRYMRDAWLKAGSAADLDARSDFGFDSKGRLHKTAVGAEAIPAKWSHRSVPAWTPGWRD